MRPRGSQAVARVAADCESFSVVDGERDTFVRGGREAHERVIWAAAGLTELNVTSAARHPRLLPSTLAAPNDKKGCEMERGRLFKFGGVAAGIVLILFGIGSLAISIDAGMTVKDELSAEKIVGSPDMSPEGIAPGVEEAGLEDVEIPDCDVAEEEIDTGDEARCFSQYMRIHALESSGGLTYAEMGRFVSADDPSDPAGTSDEAAALKDEAGNPVANAARNTWVTETALSTALNMSYMASQISLFGIVVGIALVLAGIGFLILALSVFNRRDTSPAS